MFLCIQNFKLLLILTAGPRFLFLLVLAPAIALPFLLLWLFNPTHQVHIGKGRFALARDGDVLDQITYPGIVHMRIIGIGQRLDIFDRIGMRWLHIGPLKDHYSDESTEVLDFIHAQLPYLENEMGRKKGQGSCVERYADFPPQQNQGLQ